VTIDDIKQLCQNNSIRWTDHAIKRIIQRDISRADVKYVLTNGEIIEQYPDDYPHPSCLVLGVLPKHRYIHVVCGIGNNELWIISAYHPDPEKWTNNFSKRRVL